MQKRKRSSLAPLPLSSVPGETAICRHYFFAGRILNIAVPHLLHLPLRAGRPFFIVTCWTLTISVFVRHFTQYAISATASSSVSWFGLSCLTSTLAELFVARGSTFHRGPNLPFPAQAHGKIANPLELSRAKFPPQTSATLGYPEEVEFQSIAEKRVANAGVCCKFPHGK